MVAGMIGVLFSELNLLPCPITKSTTANPEPYRILQPFMSKLRRSTADACETREVDWRPHHRPHRWPPVRRGRRFT